MKELKKIVFASHTYMGGPFVVGSHHLALEFAEKGYQVLHISTPVTPIHLIHVNDDSLRQRMSIALLGKNKLINNNLINFVPFSLLPWVGQSQQINTLLVSSIPSLKKIVKKYGFYNADLLLIDQPKFITIERYIKPGKIVYRPTDVYSQMEHNNQIDELEKKILNISDSVIATSQPVMDHIRRIDNSIPGAIVENGVEVERFQKKYDKPVEYREKNKKIAVYVGALDQRIDIQAFRELAIHFTDLNIAIIGPYTKSIKEQLNDLENVWLLGERRYEEVPSYLQHADIGLLPLNNNPANEGRSPMKLYEYAASGLPVVSKTTQELRRRNEKFIQLYTNYEEMIHCVDKMLKERNQYLLNEKDIRSQSWSAKADAILSFVNLGHPTR
jgi:teichuronic acid biosynthesis glycosyltransferase TuaH